MQIKELKRQKIKDVPSHWQRDWLLNVINQSASFLITDDDYELTTQEYADYQEGIEQMQSGTPLAYLLGQQAFWSLPFLVNQHTLIPRPDTEVLVEQVLLWIQKNAEVLKTKRASTVNLADAVDILEASDNRNSNSNSNDEEFLQLLDLGTGTGCIAISLAHELQNIRQNIDKSGLTHWRITATDISEDALDVAKENAEVNGVAVEFVQNSVGTASQSSSHSRWYGCFSDRRFDVIVSNPPYIDPDDAHLSQLHAEPLSALVAEDHGVSDLKAIIEGAVAHLNTGGLLALEHGYDQREVVQTMLARHGFDDIITIQDYAGNDRVSMGVKKGVSKVS